MCAQRGLIYSNQPSRVLKVNAATVPKSCALTVFLIQAGTCRSGKNNLPKWIFQEEPVAHIEFLITLV